MIRSSTLGLMYASTVIPFDPDSSSFVLSLFAALRDFGCAICCAARALQRSAADAASGLTWTPKARELSVVLGWSKMAECFVRSVPLGWASERT